MLRTTNKTHQPPKWAVVLRRKMQMAIGNQLRIECELPKELTPELRTLLTDKEKEHDPYSDIIGTC
jgi:hypothetical protein